MDILQCGDTVYLRGGTYALFSTYSFTFESCQNTTLISNYPNETVVFDGFYSYPSVEWTNQSGLYVLNTSYPSKFGLLPGDILVTQVLPKDYKNGYIECFLTSNISYLYNLTIPTQSFYYKYPSIYLNLTSQFSPNSVKFLSSLQLIVNSSNVIVQGIEMKGCNYSCITLLGENVTVRNCTFRTSYTMITIGNSSRITNNTFDFVGKDDLRSRLNVVVNLPTDAYIRYEKMWGYLVQYQLGINVPLYNFAVTSFYEITNLPEISYNKFQSVLAGIQLFASVNASVHHNLFNDTFCYTILAREKLYSITELSNFNMNVYQNLFINDNGSPIQTYGFQFNMTVARNIFYASNKTQYDYNYWAHVQAQTALELSMYHNQFTASFIPPYGLTNIFQADDWDARGKLTMVNNIMIDGFVYNRSLTLDNNFIISPYSINCSTYFNETSDLNNMCYIRNFAPRYKFVRTSMIEINGSTYGTDQFMLVDKGRVIQEYYDPVLSINQPDIGPFESYQVPTADWPFVEPDTNCVWSTWSEWSPCTCRQHNRTRTIIIVATGTGRACDGGPFENTTCESSTCVYDNNTIVIDNTNYTTSSNLDNSSLVLSNSTTFTSTTDTFNNLNLTASVNTTVVVSAKIITGSTISLTDSVLVYTTNVTITKSMINLEGSNVVVNGSITLDQSTTITVDENTQITVGGCANIGASKIVLKNGRSVQAMKLLLQANCYDNETVTVVDQESGISCPSKFKSQSSLYFLYYDVNSCSSPITTTTNGAATPRLCNLCLLAVTYVIMLIMTVSSL
eukprot:TRINITY_DN4085_c0_g1_i3.p1 TRINITY_DN4085_c0_g1~~TRINITY_DN4085_c0_g1_i3.p1  ORF type:complete len:791 (-),score=101.39 TRINITY_DN4085_c0_g1_i3:94-2466(-)